jgi:hypothetical protein
LPDFAKSRDGKQNEFRVCKVLRSIIQLLALFSSQIRFEHDGGFSVFTGGGKTRFRVFILSPG